MDRISLFKLSGLPDTFGALLVSFSFILMLTPYLTGSDFGLFKIPEVPAEAKRFWRITGPILFGIILLLFVPLFSSNKKTDELKNGKTTSTTNPVSPVANVSLNGQFVVDQENDASIVFQLVQNGDKVSGTARYKNGTGNVTGTVSSNGRNVDLIVPWSSTSKGQYTWSIDTNCRMVSGQTIDLLQNNSSSGITSKSSFCQ